MQKILTRRFLLISIILLSVFLGFFLFFQIIIDDSFIFYKYGYNLIHHGIWSWSIYEKPVEAYTSFLYAVLSIFPFLLDMPPHIFTKLFGVFVFILILFRIYKKNKNNKTTLYAVFLLTTNWQVYVHTFSGLETMLWFLLLLETFYVIKEDNFGGNRQLILWILCLLLTLTRPEGVLYASSYFVYINWYKKVKIKWMQLCIVVLLGVLYYAWRFHLFGLLFPLPFYHKTIENNFGLFSFIANIYFCWPYLLCAGLILYILRRNKLFLFIGILTFAIFILLYSRSFLVMNYADRFVFQLFYPLVILAVLLLEKLPYVKKISVLLVAGTLNLLILSKGIYDNNYLELASMPSNFLSCYYVPRSHYILAKSINKIKEVEKKDIKVLFGDAGVFAYYVKAKCYDSNGLTNAYLAKNKLTSEYFNKLNADLVLTGTAEKDPEGLKKDITNGHLMYTILKSQQEKYVYAGFVTTKEDGYYVHIYINRNSTHYNDLNIAMNNAIKECANSQFRIKRFIKFKYLDMNNI